MSIEEKEKEKDKSIYNYNMIFNKIGTNNSEEDIKLNTNLISDIDLRNFDPKRYEYYTNLLKIYNEDPDTLFNLLNKYNSIKYTKEDEKKLIRQIYDYAVKYTKANEEDKRPPYDPLPGKEGIVNPAAKGVVNETTGGKIISGGVKEGEKEKEGGVKDGERKDGEGKEGEGKEGEGKEGEGKEGEDKQAKTQSKQDIRSLWIRSKDAAKAGDITNYIKRSAEQTKAEEINNSSPIEKLIEALRKKIAQTTFVKNPNNVGDIVTQFTNPEEKSGSSNSDNQNSKGKPTGKPTGTPVPNGDPDGDPKRKPDGKPPPAPPGKPPAPPPPAPKGEEELLLESIKLSMKVLESIEAPGLPSTLPPALEPPPTPPPLNEKEFPEEIPEEMPEGVPEGSLHLIKKIVNNDEGSTPMQVILTKSLKLMNQIIDDEETEARQTGGGAVDEYSDDILKKRYLDTKRYNNIDSKKMNDYRAQQNARKNNIVAIETSNKIEQLSNDIDVYNNKISKGKDDDKYIIQQIRNFENDPKNPIEELALTFDDRIVFIIATFFIRYITIIMVQWCIDINIIKTFYEGFIYYAIIYILIFWFIVLFVNIDNTYDVKYMNFNGLINSIRTLFYYFYMGTNGISRLLIHTSLILILIVIPIILNIKSKTEFKEDDQNEAVVILTYEERKQLSKSLSLFTMFIWLFTSIIATKF